MKNEKNDKKGSRLSDEQNSPIAIKINERKNVTQDGTSFFFAVDSMGVHLLDYKLHGFDHKSLLSSSHKANANEARGQHVQARDGLLFFSCWEQR